MFVVGVTGGIGAGKSTVSAILASWGLLVLDADRLSAAVTGVGGAAMGAIEAAFGSRVVRPDGALDRAAMARLMFSDRMALDTMNRIVHRFVFDAMGARLAALAEAKEPAVVLDVPIPARQGFLDRTHFVVVVQADRALRLKRLMARGLREDDARRRMDVQLTPEAYAQLADVVVINNGDREALVHEVERTVRPAFDARGLTAARLLAHAKARDRAQQRTDQTL